MKHNKAILSPGIAYGDLATIKGVRFTPREIDVIACLLSGKGTKTVAQFLSIEEKTVETHKYNIMRKLECNSKEGIIHFVERSDKFSALKKHYLGLLIQVLFTKKIQEIFDLTGKIGGVCSIVYWREQEQKTSFVNQLEKHLKLGGFKVFLEVRENYKSLNHLIHNLESQTIDYIIYIVPETLLEQLQADDNRRKLETFPFIQKVSQNPGSVVFLLSNRDTTMELPSDIQEIEYVDWEKQDNHYFAVLEILQKMMPDKNLDKLIADFRKQYETIYESFERTPPQIWSEIIDMPRENEASLPLSFFSHLSKKGKRGLLVGGALILSTVCFLFYNLNTRKINTTHQSDKSQELKSIRSDLPIPAENTLLKRPKILAQIEEKFKDQQGIQTVALTGIGGSGKTTLARQYAHSQRTSVVWEINAETKGSLIGSFEDLAYALCQTEEEKKEIKEIQETKVLEEREQKLVRFVQDHFRAHPHWILIYDNVEQFEDIQKYFPHDQRIWGSGKVLVTTRNSHKNSYVNRILSIELLEPDEKLKLFIKIINGKEADQITENEKVQALQFLSSIPSFPLDVSAAAYYIKATNSPYEAYLKHLQDYNKDFELIQENLSKETSEYTKTRYRIIALSVRNIINMHKEFKDLLLLLSLLDSQNIPREFLVSYKGDILVDSFIYNLKKYSLIMGYLPSNSSGTSFFSLHRSIQSIILTNLIKNYNVEKDGRLMKDITHAVEENIASALRKSDAVLIKLSILHGNSFLSHSNLINSYMSGLIESEIGRSYLFFGDYIKAKTFLEESYAKLANNVHEKNYGKIARVLAYIGIAYKILGNYGKSKAFLKKSLSIYANHLPKPNKDSIMAASFLGEAYRECGAYEEARILLEESLLTCRKYFSDSRDEDIPRIMVHLGVVYRDMGDYEKAKAFLTQGYAIYKERYPEKHSGVAMASMFLGDVYRRLQKYEEAEELLNQALIIYKSLFSDKHLSIARQLIASFKFPLR